MAPPGAYIVMYRYGHVWVFYNTVCRLYVSMHVLYSGAIKKRELYKKKKNRDRHV